jgi:hypothetical protein
MGVPRQQVHREDRGALVLSDGCLTIVVARFLAHPKREDGLEPTVGSNYSITRATNSFCLKLDEFQVLILSGLGFAPESRLMSCSVFRQTASMEAEIDCRLPSNSS